MMYKYNKDRFEPREQKIIERICEKYKVSKAFFNVMTSLYDHVYVGIDGCNEIRKDPTFDYSRLIEIEGGFDSRLSENVILQVMKVDSVNKPIYDCCQMREIIIGFINHLTKEQVDIYSQCKNNKPIFSFLAMHDIRNFIMNADKNQIQQIKELISDNVEYEKIKYIIKPIVSSDRMRVLHSLCNLGCDNDFIRLITRGNYSYESLKEIKYMVKCAKYLGFNPNILKESNSMTIASLRWCLAEKIDEIDGFLRSYRGDCHDAIKRCLSYQIDPALIKLIIEPNYSLDNEEMKVVAAGFLRGLTIKDAENILDDRPSDIDMLREDIDEAIRKRFINIDDIKENKTFTTPDEKELDL